MLTVATKAKSEDAPRTGTIRAASLESGLVAGAPEQGVLGLQRAVGNKAMGGVLQRKCACEKGGGECEGCKRERESGVMQRMPLSRAPTRIQAKLTINEPGDRFEQEADRVADAVVTGEGQRLSSVSRSAITAGIARRQLWRKSQVEATKSEPEKVTTEPSSTAIPPPQLKQFPGITTPMDAGATADKKGTVSLNINGVRVMFLRDQITKDKTMSGRAVTRLKIRTGKIEWVTANNKPTDAVTSLKGPGSPSVTIWTVYGPGSNPSNASEYGRGTTAADKKAKTTSLGFHEGEHGRNYIQFLKDNPLPQFSGKVGMTLSAVSSAASNYDKFVHDYKDRMAAYSIGLTDCVGNTIDQSNAEKATTTEICKTLQPSALPATNAPSASPPLQRKDISTKTPPVAPSIVDGVLHSPGKPLDADTRAFMEPRFGRDFSDVRVHTDARAAESARAVNAVAYTVGRDVVFGAGRYAPGAGEGRRLLAHELAHVVQQGAGDVPAPKADIALEASAGEREAHHVSDLILRGESAAVVSAQPKGTIQRFAPGAHQAATVSGLKETFSAQEIGAIYASNWERDFSQGHPDIASAAIAWTAVKNAAQDKEDLSPVAKTFRDAVWKVVNGNLLDALDESLGGYKYWEHMDRPSAKLSESADKRWAKKSSGLAGYILDSKAYIKDQMIAAVDAYRMLHGLASVGKPIDNWGGVSKPGGYVSPTAALDTKGEKITTRLPGGWEDSKVASRAPIRDETARQAVSAGAQTSTDHDAAVWRLVGQHLGRAMHALEDFWAHSNWLELARDLESRHKAGTATAPVAGQALKTGTFEMPAKAHALGHKLLALATAFRNDLNLMLKIYGVSSTSTKLDSNAAKKRRSTIWGGMTLEATNDNELAYKALRTDSWSTVGELSDVGEAANNVEELVLSGKYTMADFLTNPRWLSALAEKGRILIKQGDEHADADSHGKIAKDQDEGGGRDHAGAMRMAEAANALVFGPLRGIMEEKDAAKALAAVQKQVVLIDTLLQVPSESHPLWRHVAAKNRLPDERER